MFPTSPLPVFLPFALVGIFHLVCCGVNLMPQRRRSKALLMPLLAAAYAFAAEAPSPAVFAALALGWLGDILLLDSRTTPRRIGGIAAFLAGHGFYVAAMLRRIGAAGVPRLFWLPWPFFLLLAVGVYLLQRSLISRELRPAGVVYYLALAVLGSAAGTALLSGAARGWAFLCGALLFFFSDSVLCRQTFTVGTPAPKYDITVMSTYLLAQTCLVIGFCA